ncbi:Fe-S oxidoreductase [Rhizobium sp. Leaf321]|uniref:DUF1289 domain-containing protein n=1 Tax=Rhizobium sp. Leaf321 TaxID=1736335 RepID=UPI00071520B0|nr:DUF1289 domain-containing protein [Rhizobium sp. Leaf321]KQQ73016.1 Fe-S oxidoreductase [Rhizobium sp. Leaf321]
MISPCTLICSIDLKTGFCVGCGRTGNEIAGWTGFTDDERIQLMDLLPTRLDTVDPVKLLQVSRKRTADAKIRKETTTA